MDDCEFKKRITSQFHGLSAAHKALGDYLLNNYEKAAFLTASRLGTIVGISESTVIRFACSLGYRGYPELQRDLQEMVRIRLSTVSRLKEAAEASKDIPVLKDIFRYDLENLKKTYEEISPEAFEKAVEQILNVSTIYILGMRSAHCLALFLGFYLEMIGKRVKVLPCGVSSIYEQLSGINTSDLMVGISFPRYTKGTIEGVEHAKKLGAKVIVITDSVLSPLSQWADITLTSASNLGSFIESFAAPLSLINALVTAVAKKQQDQTIAVLEKMEAIWDKCNLFHLSEKNEGS
jgi:DNA-binding MurR/RpiR family transcriptional regulator